MGSNLKVSGSLRWHVSALLPLARARRRWRARWQGGGERMSATEGLIDIRDVTIVIGLSQTLSNPLSSVQYDSCQLFRIQPLGRRPSSPWHTSYLIKNPASDLKKKKVSFIPSKMKRRCFPLWLIDVRLSSAHRATPPDLPVNKRGYRSF